MYFTLYSCSKDAQMHIEMYLIKNDHIFHCLESDIFNSSSPVFIIVCLQHREIRFPLHCILVHSRFYILVACDQIQVNQVWGPNTVHFYLICISSLIFHFPLSNWKWVFEKQVFRNLRFGVFDVSQFLYVVPWGSHTHTLRLHAGNATVTTFKTRIQSSFYLPVGSFYISILQMNHIQLIHSSQLKLIAGFPTESPSIWRVSLIKWIKRLKRILITAECFLKHAAKHLG